MFRKNRKKRIAREKAKEQGPTAALPTPETKRSQSLVPRTHLPSEEETHMAESIREEKETKRSLTDSTRLPSFESPTDFIASCIKFIAIVRMLGWIVALLGLGGILSNLKAPDSSTLLLIAAWAGVSYVIIESNVLLLRFMSTAVGLLERIRRSQ